MKITDIKALQHLDAAQIDTLLHACSEQNLVADEELMARGTKGGKLYFLLEGQLEVYLDENGSQELFVRMSRRPMRTSPGEEPSSRSLASLASSSRITGWPRFTRRDSPWRTRSIDG